MLQAVVVVIMVLVMRRLQPTAGSWAVKMKVRAPVGLGRQEEGVGVGGLLMSEWRDK